MSATYVVINGAGTIEYFIQGESAAHGHAQLLADEHGESFFVSQRGEKLKGLGDEVTPDKQLGRQQLAALAHRQIEAYTNGKVRK